LAALQWVQQKHRQLRRRSWQRPIDGIAGGAGADMGVMVRRPWAAMAPARPFMHDLAPRFDLNGLAVGAVEPADRIFDLGTQLETPRRGARSRIAGRPGCGRCMVCPGGRLALSVGSGGLLGRRGRRHLGRGRWAFPSQPQPPQVPRH
jgi:hypothetical protein